MEELDPEQAKRDHRLEQVSGAQFGADGINELRQLFAIYKERNDAVPAQPFWSPDDITPIQQQELVPLRALVGAVWEVWREHGGKGHGGRWDTDKLKHGAFIRLLHELFHQAGEKPKSPRTLRRVLQSVREEDERLRDEAVRVTDPDPKFVGVATLKLEQRDGKSVFVWHKKT